MGILPQPPLRVRNANGIQQCQDPASDLLTAAASPGMGRHRLGNLLANPQDRVEGGLGFLEDHPHAPPADPAHRLLRQTQQLGRAQPDAADHDTAPGWQQPHQGQGGHGLATP